MCKINISFLYRESVFTHIYSAVEPNIAARGPDIECL